MADMTNFTIDAYRPEYLPGLVASYNEQAQAESQIVPLSAELFEELVAAKSTFDPAGLLVALRDGRPVGWVHACRAAETEPWATPVSVARGGPGRLLPGSEPADWPHCLWPRICMLVFPTGDLHMGRALVAEATNWLERTGGAGGANAMNCYHGYPFYRGLASALLALALGAGWDEGARSASVATETSNVASQITYQRSGFRPHVLTSGRIRDDTQ